MNQLISIIIPVYNAESFLPMCLESIISQTYKNIEIICVDDSSTDGSLGILREYAKSDTRITVIKKNNEGVSKARNLGINQSHGEFIMFVDADDWVDNTTCERALKDAMESKADAVLWPYVSEFSNHSETKIIYTNRTVFAPQEVKHLLQRRFVGPINEELSRPEKSDSLSTCWAKLYKRSIIINNNIEFIDLDEIGTYEDGMFNLYYFQYASKAVYNPEFFYHYRRNNKESQTSKYREKLPKQWEKLFLLMKDYIQKFNPNDDFKKALENRISLSIIGLGLNIMISEKTVTEKYNMIRSIIYSDQYCEAISHLKMVYFPKHWKLFFIAASKKKTSVVYALLVAIKKIIYG